RSSAQRRANMTATENQSGAASAIVEREVYVHRRTLGDRGALLVSADGDVAAARWLPKSQMVELGVLAGRGDPGRPLAGSATQAWVRIALPLWLARQAGLDDVRAADIDDLFGPES